MIFEFWIRCLLDFQLSVSSEMVYVKSDHRNWSIKLNYGAHLISNGYLIMTCWRFESSKSICKLKSNQNLNCSFIMYYKLPQGPRPLVLQISSTKAVDFSFLCAYWLLAFSNELFLLRYFSGLAYFGLSFDFVYSIYWIESDSENVYAFDIRY